MDTRDHLVGLGGRNRKDVGKEKGKKLPCNSLQRGWLKIEEEQRPQRIADPHRYKGRVKLEEAGWTIGFYFCAEAQPAREQHYTQVMNLDETLVNAHNFNRLCGYSDLLLRQEESRTGLKPLQKNVLNLCTFSVYTHVASQIVWHLKIRFRNKICHQETLVFLPSGDNILFYSISYPCRFILLPISTLILGIFSCCCFSRGWEQRILSFDFLVPFPPIMRGIKQEGWKLTG